MVRQVSKRSIEEVFDGQQRLLDGIAPYLSLATSSFVEYRLLVDRRNVHLVKRLRQFLPSVISPYREKGSRSPAMLQHATKLKRWCEQWDRGIYATTAQVPCRLREALSTV